MRPLTLEGSTDERFSQIERILTRLVGQIPQVITCQIPPIPLSFYSAVVPPDNVVLRFIFPVGGVIKQVAVLIDDMKGVEVVSFEAIVHNEEGSTSQRFSTTSKSSMMSLQLVVSAGMALTVKCSSVVEGVWIGLLYQTHPNQAETLQIALAQTEMVHARVHDSL